jgi:hypothetical protein
MPQAAAAWQQVGSGDKQRRRRSVILKDSRAVVGKQGAIYFA